MNPEPFRLPAPVDVPIVGTSTGRSDEDEAIARLAMFCSVLAHALVAGELPVERAGFIVAGSNDLLERFGPVTIDHEFKGAPCDKRPGTTKGE